MGQGSFFKLRKGRGVILKSKNMSETIESKDLVVPSREEAKAQFDYYTKKLGLKHTFSFDEVYDFMMERRLNREEREVELRSKFRDNIMSFEERLRKVPGCKGPDAYPLKHTFAGGLYVRQVTVPPMTLTVTKIHKQEHVFFLLKGTISVLTEEGVKKFTAPYQGVTKVGTKRIIWHHDEVIFTTVHSTTETNVAKVEDQVIAKDFEEIDRLEDGVRIKGFIDVVSREV